MTTRQRKVAEALRKHKTTILDWYKEELAADIEELNGSEAQEMLLDAWAHGTKKPTIKDAWERANEDIENFLDEYSDENATIEALFE